MPELDETLDAPPYEPPKPRRSRLALAALASACAALGFLVGSYPFLTSPGPAWAGWFFWCSPLAGIGAIILANVALTKIDESDEHLRGAGWAKLAVALGFICLSVFVITLFQPARCSVKENARRAQCKGNLRQIGFACHIYADDNNEAFPTDLSMLYPTYEPDPKHFSCPTKPSEWKRLAKTGHFTRESTSYVYVSGLKSSDPGICVLAFDRPENHRVKEYGNDVNVLYEDASVRRVSEEDFKTLLDETREAVKKRGGEIRLIGE